MTRQMCVRVWEQMDAKARPDFLIAQRGVSHRFLSDRILRLRSSKDNWNPALGDSKKLGELGHHQYSQALVDRKLFKSKQSGYGLDSWTLSKLHLKCYCPEFLVVHFYWKKPLSDDILNMPKNTCTVTKKSRLSFRSNCQHSNFSTSVDPLIPFLAIFSKP